MLTLPVLLVPALVGSLLFEPLPIVPLAPLPLESLPMVPLEPLPMLLPLLL
jgi:hypothetical protein